MTESTSKDRKKIDQMYNRMWDIFNEHGGYEYNDDMFYQLQGIQESISDCKEDRDIPHMLKEAKETMAFFEWVVEYKELMDREPPQLYG